MPHSTDVAEHILHRLGPTPAMKLEKLVYYCQAWSLVWDERPLIRDEFQAWANGPVAPELYDRHRGQFIVTTVNGDPCVLDSAALDTIEGVLKFYGDKPSQWLSDLTHTARGAKRAEIFRPVRAATPSSRTPRWPNTTAASRPPGDGKDKRARARHEPSFSKTPRTATEPRSIMELHPAWRLANLRMKARGRGDVQTSSGVFGRRLAGRRHDVLTIRLTNRKRVWGVLEGPILYLLWWDPMHAVYPSEPNNT